jgi:3-methyladenine DNA glycosylase AlkD
MHPYFQPLAETYQQNAHPENAHWMKKYMKNQFEFFGIKTPDRTRINREFFAGQGLPDSRELETIVDSLMFQPQREFHYFAISLTGKMKKQWTEESWKMMEKMLLTNSWWDTVDALAAGTCGEYFKKYPQLAGEVTGTWNRHDNMWLVRSSILYQLKYKEKTDAERLFGYIRPHLESKEFFIQKAIGWALRQYARTNPEAVLAFANTHPLAPLSRREALKHLGE